MPYKNKAAQKEYAARWYLEVVKPRRDRWFRENGPCVDCGSWEDLELDHVDPKTKISSKIWSWSDERREVELKKCKPRCYGCHKKKTVIEISIPIEDHHGRYACWKNKGCRCQLCVLAQREYKRKYRAAGGAH